MGRKFWKMSGSGNDFVMFDSREFGGTPDPLERPSAIETLCARGTGVGADGVVFVGQPGRPEAALAMRYYNADGSRVDFCGNATLCVTRLSAELGIAPADGIVLETDSGLVPGRLGSKGPEIELPPVTESISEARVALERGERRIGFALVGVPHLVILVDDLEAAPVQARGRQLRYSGFRSDGVNVNFVSSRAGVWSMRTYERGVEAETLACGSGSIACAILLSLWNESGESTSLTTRSGLILTARLRREGESWKPTLAGEGRVVFTGEVEDLAI
ncbi:MAG TPA: diaminopimelate epimerase [Gemmatimonadaceae bacterium]|nr:diaminopimelate epimerase [Gemmatimonadaceae bacterium]